MTFFKIYLDILGRHYTVFIECIQESASPDSRSTIVQRSYINPKVLVHGMSLTNNALAPAKEKVSIKEEDICLHNL